MSDISGEADHFYTMLEKIQSSADNTLCKYGGMIEQKNVRFRKIRAATNQVLHLAKDEHTMTVWFWMSDTLEYYV